MDSRDMSSIQALECGHVSAGSQPDVVEVLMRGASTIAGIHSQSESRVHLENGTGPAKEWLKRPSCAMTATSA